MVMNSEPRMTGITPPTPPCRLTPPITAAAMLSSIKLPPRLGSPEPVRAVSMSAPKAASRAAENVSEEQISPARKAGQPRRARIIADQIEALPNTVRSRENTEARKPPPPTLPGRERRG